MKPMHEVIAEEITKALPRPTISEAKILEVFKPMFEKYQLDTEQQRQIIKDIKTQAESHLTRIITPKR